MFTKSARIQVFSNDKLISTKLFFQIFQYKYLSKSIMYPTSLKISLGIIIDQLVRIVYRDSFVFQMQNHLFYSRE